MLGWLPEDVSPYGADIDALFYFIYYLTAAAFIIVTALMLIFLYVYRDQGGRRAAYTHGNTAMEIIWTVIPAIVFISLGLVSRSLWEEIKLVPPETDTVVKVTGKQFNWEILYPGPDGEFDTADDKQIDNDIRVPAGKPVRVILASKDVIHSFFMPNLRFKQDMVPGREIIGWFQANKPGKYEIPCAELCGFGHSGMKGWLYALAPDEYQAWRDEQWPQTASSNGAAASEAAVSAVQEIVSDTAAETATTGTSVVATEAQDAATEGSVEASGTATEAITDAQGATETTTEATDSVTEAVPNTSESATQEAEKATKDATGGAQDAATDAATEAVKEATQDITAATTEATQDAAETIQETSDSAQKASEGAPDTTEAEKETTDASSGGMTESTEKAAEDTTAAVQLPDTEILKTHSTQEAPAEQSSPEATSEAAGQDSSAGVSSQQYAYIPTAADQSDQGEPCKGQLEILSGATIYDIAGAFYTEGKRLLGVDLIRDYNTHIENLDTIYPGQKLCIPSLTQTTRLRQEQESGAFNLILDAFRSSRRAKDLARSVQQKGYRASVIPRQISNSLLLQRVEITGLQDQTTASQAWELFNSDDLS